MARSGDRARLRAAADPVLTPQRVGETTHDRFRRMDGAFEASLAGMAQEEVNARWQAESDHGRFIPLERTAEGTPSGSRIPLERVRAEGPALQERLTARTQSMVARINALSDAGKLNLRIYNAIDGADFDRQVFGETADKEFVGAPIVFD